MSGVLHASTTQRGIINFSYTKFKPTFIWADQFFIILHIYIYLLINYYFLLNKIYCFVFCFYMASRCFISKCYMASCYMAKCYLGKLLYGKILLRRVVIWRNIIRRNVIRLDLTEPMKGFEKNKQKQTIQLVTKTRTVQFQKSRIWPALILTN